MPIAIKSRQVIDGKGVAPIPHGVVLVEGERIKAVGGPQQIGIPDGTEVSTAGDRRRWWSMASMKHGVPSGRIQVGLIMRSGRRYDVLSPI